MTDMTKATDAAVLAAVNQIRLDENLSFSKLAARIGRINARTLARALTGAVEPFDRTLYRLREFLARRDRETAQQGVRDRRRAAKQEARA